MENNNQTLINPDNICPSLPYSMYDDHNPFGPICINIFWLHFQSIPHQIELWRVNKEKVFLLFQDDYKDSILHTYRKTKEVKNKFLEKCVYYVFKERVLLIININGTVGIFYDPKSYHFVKELTLKLNKHKLVPGRKNKLCLLTDQGLGLNLIEMKIKKPMFAIKDNYNDDLTEMHPEIVKQLKKNDHSGLYLFYGAPGTGKSTYLRYLLHTINKKVIFISSGIAQRLELPDLMDLLLKNRNCVLFIEDAENLIISREQKADNTIATILNLSDGLLGETLHIQIVCTFNTQISNIDKALLRKGRLNAMYEFKALEIDKAKALAEKLQIRKEINEPTTLADIYYADERGFNYEQKREKIGFTV